MDIQSQSQDMLARLLATENIDVVRGRVRTAMFDILNRRLILPRWKEMSLTVEEMLMLHEVGHALFTGQEAYGVVFDTKKHLKTYANVIEDVRIEKKMKERYPGSRKSFNIGYRELNERDFFGVKARDLSQLLLIDRINLYYKVGFNCGVKFTPEEQLFLRRVDLCNTEDDVIKLAEEIYEYSKASHEEKKKLSQAMRQELQQELDEEEDNSYEDGDEYDMDDIDEWDTQDSDNVDSYEEETKEKPKATRTGYSPQKEEEDETQLESVTANKFEETLNQFADEDLEIQYFKPRFEFNESTNPIVDYKRIIKEISDYKSFFNKEKSLKFKTTNSPVVSYLVKEFEMRKSASSMKRAKIAKLGQLDSRKLYAYKLKDDLFRQIMQVKDGKKHGMIFLLDWSGSMHDYIEETIEQVINLAMFCQRIQIPYQVFAFTDGYGDRFDSSYYDQPASSHVEGGIGNGSRFTLLEFFSNKMSTSEFNKMIDVLMSRPYAVPNYGLNGTPLNESLLFMVDYIGKFVKNNAVEKMSFITLTDGESGALYSNEKRISNGSSWRYDKQGLARKINVKSYMRDPITKKDYDFSDDGQQQTSVLLNVIKDRYNTNNIGFFIMTSTTRSANNFVRHNMSNTCTDGNSVYAMMEKITSSLRKQKYCILDNVSGRDEYYLLSSKARIEDSNLDSVNTTMSSSQMSKALGKVFNSRKTSRVVLNKFIGMVA